MAGEMWSVFPQPGDQDHQLLTHDVHLMRRLELSGLFRGNRQSMCGWWMAFTVSALQCPCQPRHRDRIAVIVDVELLVDPLKMRLDCVL